MGIASSMVSPVLAVPHAESGFLCHKFSTQPKPALNFIARARQFSSFIVLLGRISGEHPL